ncbi:MAG: hypothetical protein NTV52_05300 [Acidobacteria bacterium]|nr:hypothetical protein [Acidobacteriota bacterium]
MSHPHQNTATIELPEVSPDEIEAELQSILRSSSFERSDKLQSFLRFICELTVRGEGGRINEYLIGSEVFRRGAGYSPSEDSVVRRQAHSLRQKLHEYYAGEGCTHSLRIELPVGRYVPNFRRIKEEIAEEVEEVLPVAPPAVVKDNSARQLVGMVMAGIALLVLGYFWGAASFTPASPSVAVGSATREIWGPWVDTGHPAVICFSTPMTAIIKHFEQLLPPDTQPKRFRAHPADEQLYRQAFQTPAGGAFYFTPAVNQTKVGEAVAGVQLSMLLTRLRVPVRTTQSRFVSWEDLRNDNMILLGHDEDNKWLDPLLDKAPFRLTRSVGKRQRAILNVTPRPGEAADYTINYAVGEREGDQEFALISMLPGMTSGQKLLLVSGLNAQATQAATEFLAAEQSLAQLLALLRQQDPKHQGPWHFQAVLKAEVHDKVPTKSWLVAVRVL